MQMYDDNGINLANRNMLLYKKEQVNYHDELKVIREFTSIIDPTNVEVYKSRGMSIRNIDNKQYVLDSNMKKIEFYRITETVEFTNVQEAKNWKNILLDPSKRTGKCYKYSLDFYHLSDFLVTGYINDSSGDIRTIHCWLEKGGAIYDFTNNLIIGKEDYYNLLDIDVINKISKEDIINDTRLILKSYPSLSIRLYCLFRNEIIRELNKNKLLVKSQ